MRRSPKVTILRHADGIPYGVNLAADYCGQHECGIEGIERVLGIAPGDRPLGIPSRTATRPAGRHLRIAELDVERPPEPRARRPRKPVAPETVPCVVLDLDRYDMERGADRVLEEAARRFPRDGQHGIVGDWYQDGLRLHAFDEGSRPFLRDLAVALGDGDAAAWLGGGRGNPFARSGLVVAIVSRLPEEGLRTMLEADLADNALKDAALATGIEARLAAAETATDDGRPFRWPLRFGHHALSPRWRHDGERDGETAHPVVFFLNPMDQRGANHGWFTVEELDAWIAGHGPIPKGAPAQPASAATGAPPPRPAPDPSQGSLDL